MSEPSENNRKIPVINGIQMENYFITKKGELWSNISKKYLKSSDSDGFLKILCIHDHKKYRGCIHRLVAEAFIPNPNNYNFIKHKDENRLNNNVENLEWCISAQNYIYTQKPKSQKMRKRSVVQFSPSGVKIAEYDSITCASKSVNISPALICNVCTGKRNKRAGGFRWAYKENAENLREEIIKPKENIRESKSIKQIDINTGEIIETYEDAVEASKSINCAVSTMRNACSGRIKCLKGFKWEYGELTMILVTTIHDENNCLIDDEIFEDNTEKKLIKRFNYDFLISFCNENNIELRRDYKKEKVTRDTKIIAKCIVKECENNIKVKTFHALTICKNFGCDDHSKTIAVERGKVTNIGIYGVDNPLKNEKIKQKIKITNTEKYGSPFPSQNQNIKEKVKATHYKRYEGKHSSQNEKVKQKRDATNFKKYGTKCSLQNENVKEKAKITIIERYGVQNVLQNEKIKQRIKITNTKKYGSQFPLRNEKVKQKRDTTSLEKFGHKCCLQNEEIKQKSKETCIKHFGVQNPMQNKEISEKNLKSAFKSKEYKFPSGKLEKVQGYEPFALNELLNIEHIDEEKIITSRTQVPEIWWNDKDNKKHRYFVDIFIPEQKRCIEVKSTWTFKKEKDKDIIFRKQNAVKEEGYSCEIWVYNEKGEKLECHK
jgi:HNH endonuclease